ncbi:hypothetical protein E2320_004474, partial [Naja naja]
TWLLSTNSLTTNHTAHRVGEKWAGLVPQRPLANPLICKKHGTTDIEKHCYVGGGVDCNRARFKLTFFTHARKAPSFHSKVSDFPPPTASAEDHQVPLRFGKEQVAAWSQETPGGAQRSQFHPTAQGPNSQS